MSYNNHSLKSSEAAFRSIADTLRFVGLLTSTPPGPWAFVVLVVAPRFFLLALVDTLASPWLAIAFCSGQLHVARAGAIGAVFSVTGLITCVIPEVMLLSVYILYVRYVVDMWHSILFIYSCSRDMALHSETTKSFSDCSLRSAAHDEKKHYALLLKYSVLSFG